MSTLADRLKHARLRADVSQTELAKRAGVSQTTIAAMETGRSIGSRHIVAISKALGVDPEWLAVGPALTHDSPIRVGSGERATLDILHDEDYKRGLLRFWFDLYEYEIQDGEPMWRKAEDRKLLFQRELIECLDLSPHMARLIAMPDRSMSPNILENDLVLIDTGRTKIQDGKIYAVAFESEMQIRQIFKEIGGALRLHAMDPAIPDRHVSAELVDVVTVVGQCIYRAGIL